MRSSSRKQSGGAKKKCPSGKIIRRAYSRKGHKRSSYRKKSGKKVSATRVSRTRVPSSCIVDRGRPGKGPYTLPKIGKPGLLSKHGYSVHASEATRHTALKRAMEEEKPLGVLRHLNLLRNYQADKKAKAIMSKDVEYLSNVYARHKSRKSASKRKSRKGSRKGSKKRSRKGSKKRSRKGSKKRSRRGSKKRSKKRRSRR